MTSRIPFLARVFVALIAAAAVAGCNDDDPAGPMDTAETFTLSIENVSAPGTHFTSGVFNTPASAGGPAPIFPGEAYEFTFGANPGDRLSFATMFVQSNDLFYAPDGDGIALFNGTTPNGGDVTAQVLLWDAGTEENQEPGVGDKQAPRQDPAGNDGPADPDMTVRAVADAYTYPAVADVIEVTLTHLGDHLFRVRIENVSDAMTLMTSMGAVAVPLAPGVFVVHTAADPLFTVGMPDMLGLEGLAEDGNPGDLAAELAAHGGVAVPLAPGVAVVHDDATRLFTDGAAAGPGLEGLAEDGDPAPLAAALDGADGVHGVTAFTMPVGGMGAAPIFPGERYEVTFTARPGDLLSLATMFVQSNDLFYAFDPAGMELFDAMGEAVVGNVTAGLALWDAGTEANQWPGAGPDQAPRQSGADTGAADADNTVRMVDDGFSYPATADVVRVTLTIAN